MNEVAEVVEGLRDEADRKSREIVSDCSLKGFIKIIIGEI